MVEEAIVVVDGRGGVPHDAFHLDLRLEVRVVVVVLLGSLVMVFLDVVMAELVDCPFLLRAYLLITSGDLVWRPGHWRARVLVLPKVVVFDLELNLVRSRYDCLREAV